MPAETKSCHLKQPRTSRGRWRYLGKEQRIYIRVTPTEKARIAAMADRAVSDFMIQAAMLGNVKFLRQYLGQE